MSRVFSGTSGNYMSAAVGTTSTQTAVTITVWAKLTSVSSAARGVWGMDSGSLSPHLRLYDDGTDRFETAVSPGGGDIQAAGLITQNTWDHYTFLLNGGTLSLLKNGTQIATGSGSYSGIVAALTTLFVGDLNGGFGNYYGKIGRTSGWARALSGGEITALAGGGLPVDAGSTARWFDYDPDTLTNNFTPAAGLTAGALAVTGTVTIDSGDQPPISGAPTATQLVITTQPQTTVVGSTMPNIVVQARTAANVLDTAYTGNVTIAIQTGAGTLAGTLTRAAVAGVATFTGLSINTLNTGAVLRVTASGLTLADSSTFNITAGAGTGGGGARVTSRLVQ